MKAFAYTEEIVTCADRQMGRMSICSFALYIEECCISMLLRRNDKAKNCVSKSEGKRENVMKKKITAWVMSAVLMLSSGVSGNVVFGSELSEEAGQSVEQTAESSFFEQDAQEEPSYDMDISFDESDFASETEAFPEEVIPADEEAVPEVDAGQMFEDSYGEPEAGVPEYSENVADGNDNAFDSFICNDGSENVESIDEINVAEDTLNTSDIIARGDDWVYTADGTLIISGPSKLDEDTLNYFGWLYEAKKIVFQSGITEIDYSFYDFKNLVEVSFPGTLKRLPDSIFEKCENLTTINFSNGLEEIGVSAFGGCISLKSVVIPEGVTKVDACAFQACGMEYLTLPSSLEMIADCAFGGCCSLIDVQIKSGPKKIGSSAFSCCESLTKIEIPDSVTCISPRAFYDCSGLEMVRLPENLEEIGESAFAYCSQLDNVEIKSGVKKIEQCTFIDCINLKNIQLSEGLTEIGMNAFHGCSGLEFIELPASLTTMDKYCFFECSALQEIEIPSGVTELQDESFYMCSNLKSVKLSAGLKKIGLSAFIDCTSLMTVDIPHTVTEISDKAFYNCVSLEQVNFPESLSLLGKSAFENCSSLKCADIPWGIEIIDWYTFKKCTSLVSVTIPSSVTKICIDAFSKCSALNSITFLGAAPEFAINCFSEVTADAYIPKGDASWDYIIRTHVGLKFTWHTFGSTLTATLDKYAYEYTGKEICPSVTVTYGGEVLSQGSDYSVSYSNNVDIGTATVSITGYGNYEDCSLSFQIVSENDINLADVISIQEDGYGFEGKPVEPNLIVEFPAKEGTKLLVENTDFTAAFSDNSKIGTATITLTGIGDYTGTKKVNFKIVPGQVKNLAVGVDYGNKRTFGMQWDPVYGAQNYLVQYAKMKDFSDATELSISKDGDLDRPDICIEYSGSSHGDNLLRNQTYYVRVCAEAGGAQGKWSEEQEINTGANFVAFDFWGFKNPDGSPGQSFYSKVFDEKQGEKLYKKYINDNGHCFGMSVVALTSLLYSLPATGDVNSLNVNMLGEITHGNYTTQLLDKETNRVMTINDLVNFGQVYQHIKEIQSEFKTNENNLSGLYHTLKNSGPVIVKLTNSGMKHAVVAYGIAEETDSEVAVSIYDPNEALHQRSLILTKQNGTLTSWRFTSSTGVFEGSVNYYDYPISFTNGAAGRFADWIVSQSKIKSGNALLEVSNWTSRSGQKADSFVCGQISGAVPVQSMNGDGDSSSDLFWIPEGENTLTEIPADVELEVVTPNHSVFISASDISDVTWNVRDAKANSVSIMTESSASFQIVFDDDGESGYTEKTSMEGTSEAGTAAVVNQGEDNTLQFSGIKDAVYEKAEGNSDGEGGITDPLVIRFDVPTDSSASYQVNDDGENLRITASSNQDGVYDEVLETVKKCRHAYDTVVLREATCTVKGLQKLVCSSCGDTVEQETEALGHSPVSADLKKATLTVDGRMPGNHCGRCGFVLEGEEIISHPVKYALSATAYTYDGKMHTPTVKVTDAKGKIISSSNYSLTYSSGRKNAGSYVVKITFKGNYSGTKSLSFKINKASQKITATSKTKTLGSAAFSLGVKRTVGNGALSFKSSKTSVAIVSSKGNALAKGVGTATITITAAATANYNKATKTITIKVIPKGTVLSGIANTAAGRLTVAWKRNSAVDGYQVQYATNSAFSGAKHITLFGNTKILAYIKGMKKGKPCYVRIRTFKKVSGTYYYSTWSAKKGMIIRK